MFRNIVLGLATLSFSLTSLAAPQGSWSKDSPGGHVSVGRQLLIGHPLHAPAATPSKAKVILIHWNISLLTAAPQPKLSIKLCHANGCQQLNGLRGQFTPSSSWPANGSYYFTYLVEARGQLRPPLRVVRNEITVNYSNQ